MRTIELNVSTVSFEDKNNVKWGAVKYLNRVIDIDEFVFLIKEGYTFCHIFKTDNDVLTQNDRKVKNFIKADFISIDIDDSTFEMKDFVNRLTRKPSIYYTTRNNNSKDGDYRYRLLYILSESIYDSTIYSLLYDNIIEGIKRDIPLFEMKDNCCRTCNQQISGNARKECELYMTDISYNIDDIPFKNDKKKSNTLLSLNGKQTIDIRKLEDVITDIGFIEDVESMKPFDLLQKYKSIYPFFDHTPLEYKNGYAIIPDNYKEIYRSWYWDNFEKDNGDVIHFQ